MTEVQPDLDSTLSRRLAAPAQDARVTRTAAALEANGITVRRAPDSAEAKRTVPDLILAGSQVHQGASERPEASGIAGEIQRSGRSGAGQVILVAGTQKIVPDPQDAFRRIDEQVYPLEDARAQAAYGVRSGVDRVLTVNREWTPRRITVVLRDEALGF
jgi:hypothetical protein